MTFISGSFFYDFYVPETRKDLILWLTKNYTKDRKNKQINWKTKTFFCLRETYIRQRIKFEKNYAKKSNQYTFNFFQ